MPNLHVPDENAYDLCIVGAGIGGLNAAFAAARHLPVSARVLLLDRHRGPGGMWNDAYSYVRLHQSHRQFTVGNIDWTLGREPSYLATRDEVAAHLRYCFEVISNRLNVDSRWGWEYIGHTEDADGVTITALDNAGASHTFRADRFVFAAGYDVEASGPLPLSAASVRSIAPGQLEDSGLLGARKDEPVWVVGSGKTAMDTVDALARANPRRRIGMVAGSGTYFLAREHLNPVGVRKWLGGMLTTSMFRQIANRFDGTNGAEVAAWYRSSFGVSPIEGAPNHMFGILSAAESARLERCTSEVVRDHLEDVVDTDTGPVMRLRSGDSRPVESTSWIVNCTGHLGPRTVEHMPYASSSGRCVSINLSSMVLVFPAISGYLLSHLLFLDRLKDAPLYEVDYHRLHREAPEALAVVLTTLTIHNMCILMDRVPFSVLRESRLDFDLWFPTPRRLAGQLNFMRTHRADRARYQAALDKFRNASGIRCGPLSSLTSASWPAPQPPRPRTKAPTSRSRPSTTS